MPYAQDHWQAVYLRTFFRLLSSWVHRGEIVEPLATPRLLFLASTRIDNIRFLIRRYAASYARRSPAPRLKTDRMPDPTRPPCSRISGLEDRGCFGPRFRSHWEQPVNAAWKD